MLKSGRAGARSPCDARTDEPGPAMLRRTSILRWRRPSWCTAASSPAQDPSAPPRLARCRRPARRAASTRAAVAIEGAVEPNAAPRPVLLSVGLSLAFHVEGLNGRISIGHSPRMMSTRRLAIGSAYEEKR